ncbi:MAG: hypothetical protein QHC67_12895 [Sphingobium sp.]|uniref:hypothetical protein n=1 Tax=Sphingobium sp. TaxID=1912891 RepID=UPI0029B4B71D|nr:hypothetical protein [Sphingobium sp.]MDX3910696.1 hypothetical protein [Sphingobium sp.]
MSDSQKAQTLANIVRIRFGDSPVFLNTTQVISGYSLQRSLTGTLSLLPANSDSTSLAGTPGITMTQTPTFTFQPVTGEAFAQSFIRPLSPTDLLPLSLSGTPIDVLFRLAVQSVNGLQNSSMLDTSNRAGSPGFYRLLINLRSLQIAGLLGVRLDAGSQPADSNAKVGGHLVLTIPDSDDPELQAIVVATRRMLGMEEKAQQAEVVYGSGRPSPGQIAILTRPILGVLGQVASEVQVSPDDIKRGHTVPTVEDTKILRRPTVIIHSGDKPPSDNFTVSQYRDRWYWIDAADFDSKLAFSVMQTLLTLAETTTQSNTVVTIPAR